MENMLFELGGSSLAAAKQVEALLQDATRRDRPQNTGRGDEIQKSWAEFYERFSADTMRDHPGLLDRIGHMARSIQVHTYKDGFPRAYAENPLVFTSPEREPRFFMYSPVDYRGDYFKPEGARRVWAPQENESIGNLLFAGGWLGNAPLITRGIAGVAVPEDFDPPSGLTASFQDAASRTYRVFSPRGQSLALVEDYLLQKARHDAAMNNAFDAIKKSCAEIFPDMKRDNPDLYVNLGATLNDHPRFSFSVRSMERGGEALDVPQNPFFHMDRQHGDYVVVPRRDTVAGRDVAEILDAVTAPPSLGDFAALRADYAFEKTDIESMIGIDGVVPQLAHSGDLSLLVYNSDDSVKSDFAPPDAVPVSTALYLWLRKDQEDINLGCRPPPMPEALIRERDALDRQSSSPVQTGLKTEGPQP